MSARKNAAEVEIKFHVEDVRALEDKLRELGFGQKTPFTREINTLYDLPSRQLRRRGELLRLRVYGDRWKLTHKSKGSSTRHKSRVERETTVGDGREMEAILLALGYRPAFRYEKFRAEWRDGKGEVVIDLTPIGNVAEIEGPPRWIDTVARKLGINDKDYVTATYAELFFAWKRKTRSKAENMMFNECGKRPPRIRK